MLCSQQGRPVAVLEASRASTDPFTAHDPDHYVEEFGEPFVFRSNGENAQFWDPDSDSRTGGTAGFSAQGNLESFISAPRCGACALGCKPKSVDTRAGTASRVCTRLPARRCARRSKGLRALTARQTGCWRRVVKTNDSDTTIQSTSIAPMERTSMELPPMPQPQP